MGPSGVAWLIVSLLRFSMVNGESGATVKRRVNGDRRLPARSVIPEPTVNR